MSEEEARDLVIQAIRTVLRIRDRPILTEDRVIADLGAESIDIFDIEFELERTTKKQLNLSTLATGPIGSSRPDFRVQDVIETLIKTP